VIVTTAIAAGVFGIKRKAAKASPASTIELRKDSSQNRAGGMWNRLKVTPVSDELEKEGARTSHTRSEMKRAVKNSSGRSH
jgi:hypothetical protein